MSVYIVIAIANVIILLFNIEVICTSKTQVTTDISTLRTTDGPWNVSFFAF
jgi:hypothetical protein